MQSKNTEILGKLKELRNAATETEVALENSGISITYIPKAQLFSNNIRNIIGAIETLMRQEQKERQTFRLERDIPDSYKNITEVKSTPQGKQHAAKLDKLKELINYFEKIYKSI